jgi:hypothetical protein
MLWATLALVASSAFEASFAGATDTPEKNHEHSPADATERATLRGTTIAS